MIRVLSFLVAVAAILAIPLSEADARPRGGHGIRHAHIGGVHHFRGGLGHRRAFFGRRHFVGPVFVASVGPTCWRWVPTAWGWRRVWVCNPYPYY
jgi:hypothetical protein